MADIAETSSIPSTGDKPVIVRVKRKAYQSPLEALWLEINERPLKRPLLDFEKISLSDSSGKEELKTKKVLVQHVDTVSNSKVTIDVLQSFMPNSMDVSDSKTKIEERRRMFKMENCQQKHEQLLVKAKQKQEILSKNARFEQIWRSRKGKKEAMHDEALHEMCHLYDVVRVDVEETTNLPREQKCTDADLEDHRIMASYLPLLREFIPSAADEVESDILTYMSEQASMADYVYDLYAVKDDPSITEEDASIQHPLVQVDDDDGFYGGPIDPDFESDDSNAEDNPLNDYPDEEASEEEEVESTTSKEESEESEEIDSDSGSASNGSPVHEVSAKLDCLEDADLLSDDGTYGDDDYIDSDGGADDDDVGGDDDWRWSYR